MKTKIVTRNAGHSKNSWRRTMPMVLGVILATIVISSSKAEADAVSSSNLNVTLVFPAPVVNQFGFVGPVGTFKPGGNGVANGSFTRLVNGDIVTGIAKQQATAYALPNAGEVDSWDAGTIGANLGNLTSHYLMETFTGNYNYSLKTADDQFPDDQANASFWLTITVGGITAVMDMGSIGPNSDEKDLTVPFAFTVNLAPGVTKLEIQMAVAADALSIRPPPPEPPPVLPPPNKPPYPPYPVPEPSSLLMLASGVLGLGGFVRNRLLMRR